MDGNVTVQRHPGSVGGERPDGVRGILDNGETLAEHWGQIDLVAGVMHDEHRLGA